MVTFKLILKNEKEVQYEYYPNGKNDGKPGIITIDIVQMKIKEHIPAEKDWFEIHTASEINKLRDDANQMRIEEGKPEITAEEWPI